MRRTTTWIAIIGILTMVGSACASGKNTGFPKIPQGTASSTTAPSPTSTEAAPLSGPVDEAPGNVFAPANFVVKVGEKITFTSSDPNAPHTATAADGAFDSSPACPSDISKCMSKGETYVFSGFNKPGTYVYYCKLHGTPSGQGMAGTITVTA